MNKIINKSINFKDRQDLLNYMIDICDNVILKGEEYYIVTIDEEYYSINLEEDYYDYFKHITDRVTIIRKDDVIRRLVIQNEDLDRKNKGLIKQNEKYSEKIEKVDEKIESRTNELSSTIDKLKEYIEIKNLKLHYEKQEKLMMFNAFIQFKNKMNEKYNPAIVANIFRDKNNWVVDSSVVTDEKALELYCKGLERMLSELEKKHYIIKESKVEGVMKAFYNHIDWM